MLNELGFKNAAGGRGAWGDQHQEVSSRYTYQQEKVADVDADVMIAYVYGIGTRSSWPTGLLVAEGGQERRAYALQDQQ